MAGVRKRTAESTGENPVEITAKESTASAKQSADVSTEAVKSQRGSTTKKKTGTGGKAATSTAPETTPDTAEKNSSATKKSGTQSSAKKTAQGKSAATGTTAKKSATGSKSSTAKKTTAGAKSTGAKKTASPKKKPANGAAKDGESIADNLPALPLIDAEALVSTARGEIGEAHPPVDFPKETVKRGFFARLGVLLLLTAVLAASVFIYLHRPSSYVERTNSVNFLYAAGENKTDVMVNGVLRGSLYGALKTSSCNARGDVYAAVVGNTLYLIRGKNIISVAENVQDYRLAAGGTALAYRTADNHLYYRKTGKRDEASLISKGCMSAAYCLSSDGRELVYTYLREADGPALLQIESFTGSKPYIESVAGLVPVAVSPKCRYIYFTDKSGALFIYNSKKGERVKCAAAPDKGTLTFNRDCTELLFTEGGATVLFIKGERRPR